MAKLGLNPGGSVGNGEKGGGQCDEDQIWSDGCLHDEREEAGGGEPAEVV